MSDTERVSLLRRLREMPVSEAEAITLFGPNEVWGPEQLRAFLIDLCIAFDRLPIVSDDCVDAALKELQLDANDEGRISQMEWKSFFVYLLECPLKHLEQMSFRPMPLPGAENLFTSDHSVVVTTKSTEMNVVREALSNVAGPMAHFIWAKNSNSDDVTGIAVFDDAVAVNATLALNGQDIASNPISVVPYDSSVVFPNFSPNSDPGADSNVQPSVFAKALASTFLFGKMVQSQAAAIDDQLHISATAKTAMEKTRKAVADTDAQVGFSQSVKRAAHSADESLHISETATAAKSSAGQTMQKVGQNPNVSATFAYVGSVFGKVKQAASTLGQETRVALEQKQREAS